MFPILYAIKPPAPDLRQTQKIIQSSWYTYLVNLLIHSLILLLQCDLNDYTSCTIEKIEFLDVFQDIKSNALLNDAKRTGSFTHIDTAIMVKHI